MKSKTKIFIIAIAIPLAVGALAAFLTRGSMDVYNGITKPPLSPPGILFSIVWTVLYAAMGFSSALIYNSDAPDTVKNRALTLYLAQLAVNFLWSIVFFNMRSFFLAFLVLIALWLLIFAMISAFKEINKLASYLQIPYLAWVSFAGYLNAAIYLLNR